MGNEASSEKIVKAPERRGELRASEIGCEMRLKPIAAPVLGGPESVRVVCYSQQQHLLV